MPWRDCRNRIAFSVLVVAGSLKIGYDLMLLYTCRNVRPPEEI